MILRYRKENPLGSYEGLIKKQPGQRDDSLIVKAAKAKAKSISI